MDDDKLTQCPFPHKFSLSKEKVQEINGQNNKKKTHELEKKWADLYENHLPGFY
jgi:hypothetical protein